MLRVRLVGVAVLIPPFIAQCASKIARCLWIGGGVALHAPVEPWHTRRVEYQTGAVREERPPREVGKRPRVAF